MLLNAHPRPHGERVAANRMFRFHREQKEIDRLIDKACDPKITDQEFTRLMSLVDKKLVARS